jgi:hypothetical protein
MLKLMLEPRASGITAVFLFDEELVVGRGAVVCRARRLIERGHDPAERLEAWRDGTMCLSGTIAGLARLTAVENDKAARVGPLECLFPCRGPPPARFSEATLSPAPPGDGALLEADQDA